MPAYRVDLYFSVYDTKYVEAENEDEALEKARAKYREVGFENPSVLMPWPDADVVELD